MVYTNILGASHEPLYKLWFEGSPLLGRYTKPCPPSSFGNKMMLCGTQWFLPPPKRNQLKSAIPLPEERLGDLKEFVVCVALSVPQ